MVAESRQVNSETLPTTVSLRVSVLQRAKQSPESRIFPFKRGLPWKIRKFTARRERK